MEDEIKLSLNKDEALVLFEFLQRFTEEDHLEISDQSEKRVLWNLCSDLEKVLSEPFQENYAKKLLEARNKLRDKK